MLGERTNPIPRSGRGPANNQEVRTGIDGGGAGSGSGSIATHGIRVLTHGPRGGDGGNGMLEDHLLLVSVAQDNRELVKALYPSQKLDPIDQVDGDLSLFLAGIVKESVLNIE